MRIVWARRVRNRLTSSPARGPGSALATKKAVGVLRPQERVELTLLRQAGGGARARRGSGLQDGEPCRRARKNGKAINANRELAFAAEVTKSSRDLFPAPARSASAGAASG